jgi:hypothetical protein
MKCNVIFVSQKQYLKLISNFTIFESLLFEGYSCKRFQTLYILINFEVVFLVILFISQFGHFLTLIPSPLINFTVVKLLLFTLCWPPVPL